MNYDDNRLWTQDVSLLYSGGRFRQLIPTKEMSFNQRTNALVRLILLATVFIYLYNRDGRYLLYGAFSAGLLTAVAAFGGRRRNPPPRQATTMDFGGRGPGEVAPSGPYDCQHPTPNNPFGNVLLTDLADNPNRPPACDVDDVAGEIERAYGANTFRDTDDVGYRRSGMMSFYTMPDTSTYQAGREAFAQACYGSGPTCKEEQAQCGLY